MKRNALLACALLASLLSPVAAAQAPAPSSPTCSTPAPPPPPPAPPPTWAPPPRPAAQAFPMVGLGALTAPRITVLAGPGLGGMVVPELVGILNETASKDTFLVTVLLLKKLGAEAKPALPAIIRNAERLNIFKGTSTAGDEVKTRRQRLAREVFEAMDDIVQESAAHSGKAVFTAHPIVPLPIPSMSGGH